MSEKNFREKVYDKCLDVVKTHQFPNDWDIFLKTHVRIGELFNNDGPSTSAAHGLRCFQKRLAEESLRQGISVGQRIVQIAKAGSPYSKWNARAAFMKVMLHFSRKSNRSAQEVWIYSPPSAYWRWIFDLLNGTESKISMWLEKNEEVYSPIEKNVMVDSVQLAMAISQKNVHLLAAQEKRTIEIVKKWFVVSGEPDMKLDYLFSSLIDGFKKITNICNSNRLILSDDPFDRRSHIEYNEKFGSVYKKSERGLYVMYIAGAYKREANSGEYWKCAMTIIHEASHLAIATRDIRYDVRGLKPSLNFSNDLAISNADSWAYFALDLAGHLPQHAMTTVWF